MKHFRFRQSEVYNDNGFFTYRSRTHIGSQVVVVRSGLLDIERGVVVMKETMITVDIFDKEIYTEFVDLPRMSETALLTLLRKHFY